MSDVVIRVENLGKKYRIRHQAERARYTALRDVLADRARSMLHAPRSLARRLWSAVRSPSPLSPLPSPSLGESEDFWALKGVSFDVRQGDVLGIIGRNGAGKSTLLKILSRITEPTEGRVRIKGRVASLLEVGTGFHPELTGRENIFLNGAILGMTRIEIMKKFDEIVDFAEVERFLDTPVKRYSSGMYVRLAFAVAAHLQPEILIVDEVLSVGDAEFQRKCLGRMEVVSKGEGRTVLFVSHNMAAVRQLCTRGCLLAGGRLSSTGPVEVLVSQYLTPVAIGYSSANKETLFQGPLSKDCRLKKIEINGHVASGGLLELADASCLAISFEYSLFRNVRIVCGLSLYRDGIRLFTVLDDVRKDELAISGDYQLVFELPPNVIRKGNYQIAFGGFEVGNPDRWFWNESLLNLLVHDDQPGIEPLAHGVLNVAATTKRIRK